MNIPSTEPKEFAVGESLKWTKSIADYLPSDGWSLSYYFRGSTGGFDVTATVENDSFVIEVAASATDALAAGACFWQAWAENTNGRKIKVADGESKVLPNLSAVASGDAFDGRSEVKKTLDAIDATLARRATSDQLSYQIGTRQLQFIPIPDLIALRTKYAQLYARECRAGRLKKGGSFSKQIFVRFKRP
jgi:hypothetical protein